MKPYLAGSSVNEHMQWEVKEVMNLAVLLYEYK